MRGDAATCDLARSGLAGAGAAHVQAQLELALGPILVDGVTHVAERLGHVVHTDPKADHEAEPLRQRLATPIVALIVVGMNAA